MLINKPPVLGRQLDRCDVCGDKWQKNALVRTQVEFLDKKGENYALQSSYDGTYWTCDASDAGTVSYGNRCDNARLSLGDDNTLSYINGVQTWEGDGTFRQASDSINAAPTSYVTISAQVGPWERNTSPDMTVVVGECDSDGNNKVAIKTWNINTTTRVWGTSLFGDLTNTPDQYFYFQVTNDGKWWIDEMQFEVNTIGNTPDNFRRTSGAVNVNSADTGSITTRKVCPDCFETVLKKSERFGKQNEKPVADEVDTVSQEF